MAGPDDGEAPVRGVRAGRRRKARRCGREGGAGVRRGKVLQRTALRRGGRAGRRGDDAAERCSGGADGGDPFTGEDYARWERQRAVERWS